MRCQNKLAAQASLRPPAELKTPKPRSVCKCHSADRGRLVLSGKKPLVALASSGLDDADAKAPCPRFWPPHLGLI